MLSSCTASPSPIANIEVVTENNATPTPTPTATPKIDYETDAKLQIQANSLLKLFGNMSQVSVYIKDEPIIKSGSDTQKGVAYAICVTNKQSDYFPQKNLLSKGKSESISQYFKTRTCSRLVLSAGASGRTRCAFPQKIQGGWRIWKLIRKQISLTRNFLRNLPRKYQTLMIGIDGYGGAGKSTFARKIQNSLPDTQIVQMDDFYNGKHIIWQRVGEEVLEPLSRNENAKFQIYEWHSEKLGEWREIKIGGIVMIEGILSFKPDLAEFYDYKIWIDCPREIRLNRGIVRDGEQWRDKWVNEWMPQRRPLCFE